MKATPSLRCTLALLAAALFLVSSASAQSIWSATNNVSANTNWSSVANWSTAAAPGTGDNVQFFDLDTTAGAAGVVNSVLDYSTNINSLWFGNTNGFHTLRLADDVTLIINGSGVPGIAGTPLINAGLDVYTVSNQTVLATITGLNGTIIATNNGAIMQVRMGTRTNPPTTKATLDMSGLGNFRADLTALRIGSESGDPRGVSGFLFLARTNVLTLRGAGFDANFSSGNPALTIGHNTAGGLYNTNGSGLYLGISNAFFVDYMLTARGNQTNCFIIFNPAFLGSSPTALFRGVAGATNPTPTERVALWKVGDNSAGSQTNPNSGTNDFTGGTLDALVDTLLVGFSRSSGANSNQGNGVLTYNLGSMNANRLTIGYNTNELCTAVGTVNVNGGTLIVNNMLQFAQVSPLAAGAVAALTTGTLNIRGGAQVFVNTITNSGGIGRLTITNGNLTVTNFFGIVGSPVNFLALSNATMTLPVYGSSPAAVVTNLAVGGTTNRLNISSIPAVASYPAQMTVIKYTGAVAGSFNLGLGTLPPTPGVPYAGFLSNNAANASVDLVLTAGPVSRVLTWTGTAGSGDWDIGTTLNWQTNNVATVYNQLDFVRFDDSATGQTNVNLTTTLFPGNLTVSNISKPFYFTGTGNLSGSAGLTKQGNGLLVLANDGVNDYFGGVTISNGTVQIGNFNTAGNLAGGGSVLNNGSLVFTRGDGSVVGNAISGSGSITKSNASGTLTLGGANTFTGAVNVVEGTLITANSSALGTTNGNTIVSSGATLDLGGGLAANALNLGAERVIVAGDGVGSGGSIVNNGSAGQQNALQNVTLSSSITIGGNARWDIRAASGTNASLSTGGSAHNLTKTGGNQVSLVGVNVDPALGHITVQQGLLSVEGNTTGLGDSSRNLTVESGATLFLFNATNRLNKNFILNGDGLSGTISNGAGANTIIGPMSLNGDCLFAIGGTSLTLSNTITGSGKLTKTFGSNTLFLNGSLSHSGGTLGSDNSGLMVINGVISGGVTNNFGSTITGTGTNTGGLHIGGVVNPGNVGSAGTYASGTLVVSGGGVNVDLADVNTIGGGVNDLLNVSGDVDLQGNLLTINPLESTLAGPYRLINYSGSLLSSFGTVSTVAPTRYTLGIDTATAGQVNLTVSGAPSTVKWFSSSDSIWDTASTPNWSNAVSATAPDTFYAGDNVLFDDTAGVTNVIFLATSTPILANVISNNSSAINYSFIGSNRISGGASIVKLGSSTLTISNANDFSGAVSVLAGTLRVANNTALGSTNGSTTIANDATLDLGATLAANALNLGLEPVFASGAGVGGRGAIVNNGPNSQQNSLRLVTLTGPTTFGGTNRWDIRASPTTTTNGLLSTGGNAYKLTKVGPNQISLVGVLIDPALGDIEVQGGIFSVETVTSSLGNPANTLTLWTNASLQFFQVSNVFTKSIIMSNGSFIVNNNGTNTYGGTVLLQGSNTFNVGGVWLRLTNVVSGSGTLSKIGGNVLFLTSASAHTGNTFVNNGTLALTNNGALASSPNITVASGATLDVVGRPDRTLTLTAQQTLKGNGTVNGSVTNSSQATVSPGLSVGILTVSSNVALLSGSTTLMEIQKSPSVTNDQLRASGSLATTIYYGGTLNVTNLGGTLAGGDSFKLFNATNYVGAFNSIVPAQPALGLRWDTSLLNTPGTAGGILRIAALPQPQINNVVLSGGLVSISGTNGTPFFSYRVLTSTNVGLTPLTSWTIVSTNTFDGSGNFSFTSSPSEPQRYFVIQPL
jgi:autotransporter-associated beta strand protein